MPKPANSVEPTIASGRSDERSDQRGQSDRKPGKKQYAKKQGAPTKKQRKAEARAERRYEDDRQYRRNRDERDDRRQGGKRIHRKEIRVIHDERGEDAKRYDRRMEAKYGDSGRRGGHGERHDKHAGERQGKPFRKHAKIRKAPFRLPLTYVNGQAKSRSFQQSQGMNGFFYTGYRSISR